MICLCVSQAAAAVPGPVGTDFKPLNSTPATTTEPPKPTFPAYTQSTASTTSTTNSTAAKPATSITSKPATLTTTSATSKLIHPDEDISLVSENILIVILKNTAHADISSVVCVMRILITVQTTQY